MIHLLMVGYVSLFWPCLTAINVPGDPVEALACVSVDLLDVFSAAVAMDAAQSASAINPELNRI
jgi:hypothetical protein